MSIANIHIPARLLADPGATLRDLISWTYEGTLGEVDVTNTDVLDAYANRCIVTPTNEAANHVNDMILQDIDGDLREYWSIDTLTAGDASEEHYPVEFLNTIEASCLPPHRLRLRIGSLLMVIRNYAPRLGVCNGTRVLVKHKSTRALTVVVLTGPKKGSVVDLPRMCCDAA